MNNSTHPPPPPTICMLCGEQKCYKREGKVRDNDSLEILECSNCGLVFLSSVDHIKENFYEDSGMHDDKHDLQKWIKDTVWDDSRRFKQYSEVIKNKDILDFGCGTGGFLKQAKSMAANVYGIEIEKKLEPHFLENELVVYQSIEQLECSVDYIFLFHVLEHIKEPFSVLEKLKQKLKSGGKLIIEVPNSEDALLTLYENKAFSCFTYWSPHLYLYNHTTLEILAKKAGLRVDAIQQIQRYPLANHLYWLSNGKPGGHIQWDFLNDCALNQSYEHVLASLGKCDTLRAYFSLIS